MILKIAIRNIARNRRRSAITAVAIVLSAVATTVFGQFVTHLVLGLQTTTVGRIGHLTLFQRGYYEFGSGNPALFSIEDYREVLALVENDAILGPMIAVATPTVVLSGVAGSHATDASRTFVGVGVRPSDRAAMYRWDGYGITGGRAGTYSLLSDDREDHGVIGVGLAHILGLCQALKLGDCPPRPPVKQNTVIAPPLDPKLLEATELDRDSAVGRDGPIPVQIELLASTPRGTPNVVTMVVDGAIRQGVKPLDDSYVGMHFSLAQRLLFGRSVTRAVSVTVQLRRTGQLPAARARLVEVLNDAGLDLDIRSFREIEPSYDQVVNLYRAIFSFIAAIMGIIVTFTVTNAVTMNVVERTGEIGTVRALGVRRAGVRNQFVAEALILGVACATLGIAVAWGVGLLVNLSGLSFTPPGATAEVPLRLMVTGIWALVAGIWTSLVAITLFAALIPARRAARMTVIDAIRHV